MKYFLSILIFTFSFLSLQAINSPEDCYTQTKESRAAKRVSDQKYRNRDQERKQFKKDNPGLPKKLK
jgi:hypothetical protein